MSNGTNRDTTRKSETNVKRYTTEETMAKQKTEDTQKNICGFFGSYFTMHLKKSIYTGSGLPLLVHSKKKEKTKNQPQ